MAKVTANTISASRTAATIHCTRLEGAAAGGGGGSSVMRWAGGPAGFGGAPAGRSGRKPSRAMIGSCGSVLSFMALLLAWWCPSTQPAPAAPVWGHYRIRTPTGSRSPLFLTGRRDDKVPVLFFLL